MLSSLRIDRQVVAGLGLVIIVAAVLVGTLLQYNRVFAGSVDVRVTADRAGITMDTGAPVKLYGVVVGRVSSVEVREEEVDISLELDPDEVDSIPRGVTAQLVPPTAFGAKYVQLTAPADEDGESIEQGDVITATATTVEVDETFTNLTGVLEAARPAQVSQALSAVAGALDERGEVLGELITLTETYLTSFNPSLPALSEDLRRVDDVAAVYDLAREDLTTTLDGAATTLETVVQQQASLRALELSLTSFSSEGDDLLRESGPGLSRSLRLLDPVTGTLARYSPELPCLIEGLAKGNELAEIAVGGTNPGITTFTHVVRGREPYQYATDLKVLGENRGPNCFGLPYVTPAEASLTYGPTFDTGVNPFKNAPSNDVEPFEILGLEDR
jgi:phospholipid/cholesterol/gamma-HCH transport system substrate-binding protein